MVDKKEACQWKPGERLIELFRGVHANHPELNNAMLGSVIPGDINSSVSPAAHNAGGVAHMSPYTSWTSDPDVANGYALSSGPGGVVLKVFSSPPSSKDAWRWEDSPDIYFEQEVLLFGVRHNVSVLRPW
jgi:hypothetical protein